MSTEKAVQIMIITHKMQNKAMQAIIDFYDANPSSVINENFLTYSNVCSEAEVRHLIDVLCSKNLITYDFELHRRVIRLKPDGKKYFEVELDEKHRKRVENIKYIITTLIAVIALILAGISLLSELGLIQLPQA